MATLSRTANAEEEHDSACLGGPSKGTEMDMSRVHADFVTEGNVTHMSRWWKYEYDGISES